ncbi:hypothetical protein [Kitasatospora purpeofusca]|uniref:DUF7848 domain-containing protein n=1 Tax=Kitasatospora purpeofusca TaxID=67352 RepID=UPI00386D680B|nr:YeeE/YedE family protein [Kitasatospora purpeofusca]
MTAGGLEPVDPWQRLDPRRARAQVIRAGFGGRSAGGCPVGALQRPRQIFRFLNWTLQIDMESDRPPRMHRYRCLGESEDGTPCGAEGVESSDFATAQKWTAEHLRVEQDHRSYEHVVRTPWLMVPAEEP